jgi:aldose 1-epimerase
MLPRRNQTRPHHSRRTRPQKLARCLILALLAMSTTQAQSLIAERIQLEGFPVIRLADPARNLEVRVAPTFGNNAFSFQANGQELFYSPSPSLKELHEKTPLMGNPLLAPWANRLDREGFFANGKFYRLNPSLNNVRYDANRSPIHGLLAFAREWQVVELRASPHEAAVVSRLEFWRFPDRMAQFPFAHTLEMTYRLTQGRLEVQTRIENHSSEPMPLSLAYHPYFQLPGNRDDWSIDIPASQQIVLNRLLMPTGERRPFALQRPQPLAGIQLDDIFTGLTGPTFTVRSANHSLAVTFDPNYPVAVIYAPQGRNFLCIEPMTGLTNAFNLAHAGVIPPIPTIPPDGVWSATFSIEPKGF